MRKILSLPFLILTPFLTFVLVTTIGKDFTNSRAPALEVLFQYAERMIPKGDFFGLDTSKLHEKLDEEYGWCTKYKPLPKKAPAPTPPPATPPPVVIQPIPGASTPAATAKAAATATPAPPGASSQPSASVAASTNPATPTAVGPGSSAVVAVPVKAPPPAPTPPPANIRNIFYGIVNQITDGFEVYCKNADGDAIVISGNPVNLEIQRYQTKPLLSLSEANQMEISTKNKYSFYIATRMGDLYLQGTGASNISFFTENLKLHIRAKSGKVLITQLRANSDPRTIVPIQLESQAGTSIQWQSEQEIRDGKYAELGPTGLIFAK